MERQISESKGATVELLDRLAADGFTETFKLDNGLLRCTEREETFRPKDLKICGMYRFEGASDPDDSRVVYSLEAKDGTRGVVVDAFGVYASSELAQFLDGIYDAREESANK